VKKRIIYDISNDRLTAKKFVIMLKNPQNKKDFFQRQKVNHSANVTELKLFVCHATAKSLFNK